MTFPDTGFYLRELSCAQLKSAKVSFNNKQTRPGFNIRLWILMLSDAQ